MPLLSVGQGFNVLTNKPSSSSALSFESAIEKSSDVHFSKDEVTKLSQQKKVLHSDVTLNATIEAINAGASFSEDHDYERTIAHRQLLITCTRTSEVEYVARDAELSEEALELLEIVDDEVKQLRGDVDRLTKTINQLEGRRNELNKQVFELQCSPRDMQKTAFPEGDKSKAVSFDFLSDQITEGRREIKEKEKKISDCKQEKHEKELRIEERLANNAAKVNKLTLGRFFKEFGTHYVLYSYRGARLKILLDSDCLEKTESLASEISIKLKYLIGANAGYKKKRSSIMQNADVTIDIACEGAALVGLTESPDNIQQALQLFAQDQSRGDATVKVDKADYVQALVNAGVSFDEVSNAYTLINHIDSKDDLLQELADSIESYLAVIKNQLVFCDPNVRQQPKTQEELTTFRSCLEELRFELIKTRQFVLERAYDCFEGSKEYVTINKSVQEVFDRLLELGKNLAPYSNRRLLVCEKINQRSEVHFPGRALGRKVNTEIEVSGTNTNSVSLKKSRRISPMSKTVVTTRNHYAKPLRITSDSKKAENKYFFSGIAAGENTAYVYDATPNIDQCQQETTQRLQALSLSVIQQFPYQESRANNHDGDTTDAQSNNSASFFSRGAVVQRAVEWQVEIGIRSPGFN